MGILKTPDNSRLIYLKPVHVFGRDPSVADYILSSHSCSRMHCVVKWHYDHWVLVDESKNGCFINGELADKGAIIRLFKGDTLSVAGDEDPQWTLVDENCSKPALVQLDASECRELNALNILPSEAQPECQIFKGGKGWVFETDQDTHPISEGSQIVIGGKRWIFYPNQLLDKIEFRERSHTQTLTLEFSVSRNEEHVQLSVNIGGKIFDLGNKTYHYLLLEMARYPLEDDVDNIKEQGWITNDLLLLNLKIDVNHLNVQIYRATRSINKFSKRLSESLIERRRGEIRLKPCNILINKDPA
jgi:hypothetical protein